MPIALDRDVWPVWLGPDIKDPDALQSLLTPSMEKWQRVLVSKAVGSVKNDLPDLIQPIKLQQGLL